MSYRHNIPLWSSEGFPKLFSSFYGESFVEKSLDHRYFLSVIETGIGERIYLEQRMKIGLDQFMCTFYKFHCTSILFESSI